MKNKLSTYREKRNFKKSPEPRGKKRERPGKIFIVQKHAASHLHYDFRLEMHGVLLSWAVPKGPCLDPAIKRLAIHVEDHPLSYATFEGVIPEGQYGGGTVMLWDKGKWEPEDSNPYEAYRNGHMTFILKGKRLKGKWKLIRLKQDDKTWLLMKSNDKSAKSLKQYDITKKENCSIVTKFSMNDIANHYYQDHIRKKGNTLLRSLKLNLTASPFPDSISPQLATLVKSPPPGSNWLHEIKLDGYRILAIKKNDQTTLYSRNRKNWTRKFSSIANQINELPLSTLVLDGEIVVLNKKNQSDFQLLQQSIKAGNDENCIYYIFDILYYDQFNLMKLPLIQRKKILQKLAKSFDKVILRYHDHIAGRGKQVFRKSCELGLEGIISKQANAPYAQRRTSSWLKTKCLKQQKFYIGGFTAPKGSRKYMGSLLIGTRNPDKKLYYHGRVGTGLSETSLKFIQKRLHPVSRCPFTTTPPHTKNVSWVKPILVAEIAFSEWTKDKRLRHPVFKKLK